MSAQNQMPSVVVDVRSEICGRCDAPCENQNVAAFHSEPCSRCPRTWIGRWSQYGQCSNFTAPARGLGDVVAGVAQPIARGIDAVFRTNLQNCGGCKERQAALNKILPNI